MEKHFAIPLEEAEKARQEGGNWQSVHTEAFCKGVLWMSQTLDTLQYMVLHKKSFRMEVNYDAEAFSAMIVTKVLKELEPDGSDQEAGAHQ